MATTVIVVEAAPPRIRGWLAVWLLQVHAGVYVGRLSKRVRERVIRYLEGNLGRGNAVIVWGAANEQQLEFHTIGRRRRIPVDLDGIALVRFLPEDESVDSISENPNT